MKGFRREHTVRQSQLNNNNNNARKDQGMEDGKMDTMGSIGVKGILPVEKGMGRGIGSGVRSYDLMARLDLLTIPICYNTVLLFALPLLLGERSMYRHVTGYRKAEAFRYVIVSRHITSPPVHLPRRTTALRRTRSNSIQPHSTT